MQQKILVIHPALAFYRIDFFNNLCNRFEAKFFFEYDKQKSQNFSENYLRSKCAFSSDYLKKGFELFGRPVRFGINEIIRKEKPEVILCSEFGLSTIIVFIHYLFTGDKFRLYTICDDSLTNSKNRKGLHSILKKLISKNIDGIIVPSQEVGNWYQNNVSSKPKILVLPIGHNDKVFRRELMKSLNVSNLNLESYKLLNTKVILYVGRLVKVKNLAFLIRAIAKVKETNYRLVFVGDGSMMNELKNEVDKYNLTAKVLFLGKKEGSELFAWYNIGQLFVLPSTFDQFGAVVNEALLAGCRVLCSEIAGASTLINPHNGKCFNPYDLSGLTKKIDEMLQKIEPWNGQLNDIRENKMSFIWEEKIDYLLDNL